MAGYPGPSGVTVKSEPMQYDEEFEFISVPRGHDDGANEHANDPSSLQAESLRRYEYTDPYVCHKCNVKFSDFYAWRSHSFLVHSKERKYMCNLCGHTFSRKILLRNHMMCHDGEESDQLKFRYKCEICGRKFMQMGLLETHKWVVHQRADDADRRIINGAKNIRQENRKASSDFEFVAVSTSGYDTVATDDPTTDPLEGTEQMTFQLGSPRPYGCEVCDYRTTQLPFLQKHLANHTKSDLPACIEFGFACNEESQLERHLQESHTQEKLNQPVARNDMATQEIRHSVSPPKDNHSSIPSKATPVDHIMPRKPSRKYFKSSPSHLTCSICDFETDQPSCLKTHVCMKHNGNKALVCTQRDFRCTEESKLKDHMTEAHPRENSENVSYACEFCSRKYRTSEELTGHVAAGQYKCKTCEYKSSNRCFMETHSEKCLTCRQCGFIGKTKASVTVHAKVHAAAAAKHEKIEELDHYSCYMCDFRCCDDSVLELHMKVAHLKKASVHLRAEKNLNRRRDPSEKKSKPIVKTRRCGPREKKSKPIVKIQHCKICDWEFVTEAEFANHMVPGKYICGVCNFVSCYKCDLRAHKKSHDEKVFSCGFSGCDFISQTAASLIIHKRFHKN